MTETKIWTTEEIVEEYELNENLEKSEFIFKSDHDKEMENRADFYEKKINATWKFNKDLLNKLEKQIAELKEAYETLRKEIGTKYIYAEKYYAENKKLIDEIELMLNNA